MNIFRRWHPKRIGKPDGPLWLIQKGSVDPKQMNGPLHRLVRGLTDEDFQRARHDVKQDFWQRAVYDNENARRENYLARWALGISIVALMVSGLGLAER